MQGKPVSSLPLPFGTKAALTRAGYETLQDILSTSVEALSRDLDLPLSSTQDIISASQKTPEFSLTQNAASMAMRSGVFEVGWTPIDKILGGGISRGNILEISGPPGCHKDKVVIGSVTSFIKADEEVLFIDCQNMAGPVLIRELLKRENLDDGLKLVTYLNLQSLVDFLSFLNQLPEYIKRRPNTGLLVISSISFPLQFLNKYPANTRNSVLERVKQALAKACAVNFLTIIITSQMSSKMLNVDGSSGNFNSASAAVLGPQIGPTYLPVGRTHRVVIVPDSRCTGTVRLLSSPALQTGNGPQPQEPYELSWELPQGEKE